MFFRYYQLNRTVPTVPHSLVAMLATSVARLMLKPHYWPWTWPRDTKIAAFPHFPRYKTNGFLCGGFVSTKPRSAKATATIFRSCGPEVTIWISHFSHSLSVLFHPPTSLSNSQPHWKFTSTLEILPKVILGLGKLNSYSPIQKYPEPIHQPNCKSSPTNPKRGLTSSVTRPKPAETSAAWRACTATSACWATEAARASSGLRQGGAYEKYMSQRKWFHMYYV